MYALDSHAVIHALKGKGRVAERLVNTPRAKVAIPAVVHFEVTLGTLGSSNPALRQRQLDLLVGACRILNFDENAATQAGVIQAGLQRIGKLIGPMDVLIAATAMVHGATLVTHNIAEFSRVPGLKVEDWF